MVIEKKKNYQLSVLAIIPARGGSQVLPGKNIKEFCGKPLLAWSIIQAQAAGIKDVVVSSDSEAILKVARDYGAITLLRPGSLSTPTASSESALLHALDWWGSWAGYDPDLILFLQCTSPLREPEDIAEAIVQFETDNSDALFSASILDDLCVWKEHDGRYVGATFDPYNRIRRQDSDDYYLENGNIYLIRPAVLRKYSNRTGERVSIKMMPAWKSNEIDNQEQWELCQHWFQKKLLNKVPNWQKEINL